MRIRTAVSALALAMAATSASATPMFTTTISDDGDGTANFQIENQSDAGESINSFTFSLAGENLTFDSISNPQGTAVSNSTNSGDKSLMVSFDSFTTGQSYSFNSLIRQNDNNEVDDATDALFGAIDLNFSSDAGTFSAENISSAQTTLPRDTMDGDGGNDNGDSDNGDSDNGDNNNGGGNGAADVPEPGTLGLMGLGLVGLASTYRRRKMA